MQSLQLYSFRHFIFYTEQIILQRRSNPHGSIFADSQNSSQSTSPFLAGKKNKANHAGAFTVHILHACKCHQMKSISGRNGFQHSVRGIYGPPLVYNCCCRNPSFLGFRFFAFGTPRPRPLPRPFPLELALAFRRMPRSTTGTVT